MDTISLFSTSFLDELEKIAKFRKQFPITTARVQINPVTPAPTPSFRVKLASTQTVPPNQVSSLKERVNMGIKSAFRTHMIEGQKPTVLA